MQQIREAARVVLVDQHDRVLLLWHSRPLDDDHWAPPGGGLDPGEDARAAAAREVREEVGVTGLVLRRPVWTWTHRYSRHGVPTEQHETLFVSRIPAVPAEGAPGCWTADGITAVRWWALPDLASCTADVWPLGLAALLPGVLAGDLDPAHPQDLNARTS